MQESRKKLRSSAGLLLSAATILGSMVGMSACAVDDGDASPHQYTGATSRAPGDRPIVDPLVSADWPGHQLRVSAGVWRDAGTFAIAAPGEADFTPPVLDESLPNVPDETPGSLMMGDPATGKAYQIDIPPEDLAIIGEYMAARGAAAPTETDETAEEGETYRKGDVDKGWSGGVDNRIDRGISRNGVNSWPYRAIGQMKVDGTAQNANGYCTGTFVGSAGDADTRYILSAAHCFWDSTSGAYNDPDFWPRQDRCRDNQNNNLDACDQGPFGQWDGGQWLMYTYFVDNCSGLSSISAQCQANDIAIMRVHRTGNATFPGAIGLDYASKSYLDGRSKYMRGYPNCGGPGDPVPTAPTVCLPRTLYGDNAFGIGTGDYDDSGYPRRVPFSADVSPGTSGASAYYYDSGNVYSFGVASVETCSGSACTGTNVNYYRAITPSWYNSMLNFMGL